MCEYKIVECSSPENLARHVNLLIKEGWRPTGGVTALVIPQPKDSPSPGHVYLLQAMTRD